MSVFLAFNEYVKGQDPVGDMLERIADKYCHDDRVAYPFIHLSIIIGDQTNGYYRADCLTTGIAYSHTWDLPSGHVFVLDSHIPEVEIFYRAWHPSTKKYKTSLGQMRRQVRGETYTSINLGTGEMNCITFALLCCGRLELPHRLPELYRALEHEGCIKLIITKGTS